MWIVIVPLFSIVFSGLAVACQHGDIRLAGLWSSSREGTVDVCLNGVWGTVSDDYWSTVDANVVCRQLGYSASSAAAYCCAHFGQGTGPTRLDNVGCSGSERRLIECSYIAINVGRSDDAGVSCQPAACQNGDLRLVNGTSSLEGRVEVCLNGRWGTVSDDSWSSGDANVVCRQLGHAGLYAVAYSYANFGQGTGPIFLDAVGCYGTERRLIDCTYDSYTAEDSHSEDAGVRCQPSECQNGDLRLVGGTSSLEGRVEVCLNRVWGTVCDDSWSSVDANVVCKQLGYSPSSAIAYPRAQFGEGTGPIFLDDVGCYGTERRLIDCTYDSNTAEDDHYEDAGVRCRLATCQNGDLRLVNGTSTLEGRVEVCLNGRWGTVCDDFWSSVDAKVVCRQLGYSPFNVVAYSSARFGQGTGPIFLDGVGCYGSEQRLIDCTYDSNTAEDYHYEDAGVRCQLATCQNGDLRLEGSTSTLEGRVEVCLNGRWGTVSEDSWSSVDANVVCRQLGYSASNAVAYCCAQFGQGTGPIFLDNVGCYGSEQRLIDCTYDSNTAEDYHYEDAGVRCQLATCENGDLRLEGSTSTLEGRVEVCLNGRWGTVCDDSWSSVDANVVCRQLGHSAFNAVAYSSAHFGQGGGLIVLDDVQCIGLECRLIDCPHDSYTGDCSHSEDAGVRCQSLTCQYGSIRLVDGNSALEGRVEVCLNGVWGTVCDQYWSTSGASVACRQLGYSTLSAVPHNGPYFGSGSGQINRLQCLGSESSLISCSTGSYISYCTSHTHDAGVTCRPSLPGSPQSVTVRTTARSLSVSWLHPQPAQKCDVISAYRVSCTQQPSCTATPQTYTTSSNSTLQATISVGLHPNTTYRCCVSAITMGSPGESHCTSTITSEAAPSGPPQTVQASVRNSSTLNISWSPPPQCQQNGRIRSYSIQLLEQTTRRTLSYTAYYTTITDTALHPYYVYELRIAAVTVGTGPYSNAISRRMDEDIPSASPQHLTGSIPNPQTLSLTWSLPPPEHRNGVIREYRINITERETGRFEQLTSQHATTTVYSLKGFHNYTVLVAAVTIGTGPYSEELNVQMPQDVPAEAPEILNTTRVSATSVHVIVRPLTVEESRGIVTSYHIRYNEGSCSDLQNGQSGTFGHHDFTVTGLDPRASYCLAVAASTVVGVGDYSETSVVGLYPNSLFQILFSASIHCLEWLEFRREDKVADIVSDVTTVLRARCNCSITADYIGDGRLLCSTNNSATVTFQARLINTDEVNSTQLLRYLQEWVSTAPSILVEGVQHHVLDNCSVQLDSLGSEKAECTPPAAKHESQGSESAILVVILVFAVLSVILLTIILVATMYLQLYRKTSKDVARENQERPDGNEYQDRPPTFSLPWETHAALQRMVEAPDRQSESESEKCEDNEQPPPVPLQRLDEDNQGPPPVPPRQYLEDDDNKASPINVKAGGGQNQKVVPLQQESDVSNAIQGENTSQEGPTHSAYSLLQTHKPSEKHAGAAFEMKELAHKAATAAAQRGKAQEEHIYQPLIPKRIQSLGQNPDHRSESEYQSLTTRQQP